LLREQKVVDFVHIRVIISSLSQSCTLLKLVLLATLQLLVSFQKRFLSLGLVYSQLLALFDRAEDMSRVIVCLDELENVCVKRWHSRLDVVEQVGLLDVTAVDLYRDFFEKLANCEFGISDLLMVEMSDELTSCCLESLDRFEGKAVSLNWLKSIV
jgi:hypothetical protein